MHALLLTTSTSKKCFEELLNKGNTPNPSNQHFYRLFGEMLSLKYNIDVLSYRPITSSSLLRYKYEKEEGNNITYHYLPFTNIKGIKNLDIINTSFRLIKSLISKDSVIFVDTLNISLVKLAFRISKKYNLPIVGIVTDYPTNLSGVSKKYVSAVLKYFPRYDLYYCLTKGLEEKINIHHRPSLIIEGLLDQQELTKEEIGFDNYFFFAGALYKRYGIENLLKAFHKWNGKYNLLIAGHGKEAELVRKYALEDNRIHYLGLLPVEKVLFYERNALLNINPRPFTTLLDELSVPSKTIEYAVSGTLMMTTENTHLHKILGDDALFIGKGEVKDIYNGFVDFSELTLEERKKKARNARAKILKLYSLKTVVSKVDHFLRANISASNFLTNDSNEK